MTTFVTIIYVAVSLMLVLGILLQSGRGGGLGGISGASQQVFGGGGGSDFMGKLTQSFAALFVLCAIYLAYASAHTHSSNLAEASQEVEVDNDVPLEEVDWEMIAWGGPAMPLADGGQAPPKVQAEDEAEKAVEADAEDATAQEAEDSAQPSDDKTE